MASVSRQIGWSNESNLLYQILKQITKLTSVVFGLKPKYKVFTALLTQSGGSQYQEANGGDLLFKGYTYLIVSNGDSGSDADLSEFGAPNNNVGTYFICSKDGNAPVPSTGNLGLGYDLGAPVATVLENTIGNIWFKYVAIGFYSVNSNNLFIEDKTAVDIDACGEVNFPNDSFISNETIFPPNIFQIYTTKASSLADEVLTKNRLEIKVYY